MFPLKRQPSCLVYFTDLCCGERNYGQRRPDYPVVWVWDSSGLPNYYAKIVFNNVPYGAIIEMENQNEY